MSFKDILFDKEEGIAIITLNRPDKLNAFTADMRASLFETFEEISDTPDIRVIIITGSGRGFCAGRDWNRGSSFDNPADIGLGERHRFDPGGWEGLRLHQIEKPTIAAVNGVAVGGGFGLMLSCDFRIASEDALMGPLYIRRGLALDWGVSYYLPRLIGLSRALEVSMTGELLNAQEAYRIGLVNAIVPSEKLLSSAKTLAAKLVKNAPIGLQLTKREIYAAQHLNIVQTLEYESYLQSLCVLTEDFQEGIQAFMEKREPNFKGR